MHAYTSATGFVTAMCTLGNAKQQPVATLLAILSEIVNGNAMVLSPYQIGCQVGKAHM